MTGRAIPDNERRAFIRCVVKNHIRDLISERIAGCRDVRKNAWSLDEQPPTEGCDDPTRMDETMDCGALLDRFGMRTADSIALRDLRIDLAEAIRRMPKQYAPVITAVMKHGGNILAAGRELKRSRKQMATAMEFIRGFFEGAKISRNFRGQKFAPTRLGTQPVPSSRRNRSLNQTNPIQSNENQ